MARMYEQKSDQAAKTFLVRVYECGCVLELGGVPEAALVTILSFPKCAVWREAYDGDDLEVADAWAERHFESTPHRVEYRTA